MSDKIYWRDARYEVLVKNGDSYYTEDGKLVYWLSNDDQAEKVIEMIYNRNKKEQ
jgi:hypothetical protein